MGRVRALVLPILVLLLSGCEPELPIGVADITDRVHGFGYEEGRLRPLEDVAWVGEGWHGPERRHRWTSAEDAYLELPLRDTSAGRAILKLHAPGETSRRITLTINNVVLGSGEVGPESDQVEIEVREGVLREGINELIVSCDEVSRVGGRNLGVSVKEIRIQPGISVGSRIETSSVDETRGLLDGRHWIEDREGLLGSGPVEVDWAALSGSAEDTLELLRYVDGALEVAAAASLVGAEGTAALEFEADEFSRYLLRTRSGSAVKVRRVRQRQKALPDVLLIVVDTWRGDHLGVESPGLVDTPNLDALAGEGVWYSAAFAHIPITGPSHASLFTGRLPSEAGVVNNHVHRLGAALPTFAEYLGAFGYQSEAVVSLDPIHDRFGFGAGFQRYQSELGPGGILSSAQVLEQGLDALGKQGGRADQSAPRFDFVHFCDPHEPYDALGIVDHRARLELDGEVILDVSTSDYSPTDLQFDVASGPNRLVIESEHPFKIRRLRILDPEQIGARFNESVPLDRAEKRFELTLESERAGTARMFVCLDDADGSIDDIRARYVREVASVDRAIGEVFDAVRSRGRWENTLVIVTSDHGEGLGYAGDGIGHVESLSDGLTRVPLIIKAPQSWGWKTGVRRDDLVALSDLPVAILSALGIWDLEGATGRDVFRRPRAEAEAIFLETHAPQAKATKYALRDAVTKLIWTPVEDRWEFYDLRDDPEEQRNVYDASDSAIALKRAALEARVQELMQAAGGRAAAVLDEESAEILRSLGYVN